MDGSKWQLRMTTQTPRRPAAEDGADADAAAAARAEEREAVGAIFEGGPGPPGALKRP